MEARLLTALEESESQFRDALDRRNRQLAITKQEIATLVEDTARCGVYAREMQLIVGEKRFDVWFAEKKFNCSLAAAKAFIKFSERGKEVDRGFKRLLLAIPGIIEAEQREDGSQHKLPQPECKWISALMKAIEQINAAREHSPIIEGSVTLEQLASSTFRNGDVQRNLTALARTLNTLRRELHLDWAASRAGFSDQSPYANFEARLEGEEKAGQSATMDPVSGCAGSIPKL